MVPTPFGKFLKVPEFPHFSRACKVLEIDVVSEKFWKFDVRVLRSS